MIKGFEYKKIGNRAVVKDRETNQTWVFQDWEGVQRLVQDMNKKAVTKDILFYFREALDWYQSIEKLSEIPPVVKVGDVF